MEAGMITSLEQQIHFYLSYHQNKTNRILHIISIPILYLSFLLFATYLNAAFILTFLYVFYVFYLDTVVGSAFLPFAILLYSIALGIHANTIAAVGLAMAVAMQIVAWVLQLSGHSVYEGNKPAFVTSFIHAVLAAPIVIYLEALFSMGLLQGTQSRLEGGRDLTLASADPQPAAQYGGTT